MTTLTTWKLCSSCKTEIGFSKTYWVCSVSTCTRSRTGFFFCSVPCWEAHLPMMRHREAFAVEMRSPSAAQWEQEQRDQEDEDAREQTRPGHPPGPAPAAPRPQPPRPVPPRPLASTPPPPMPSAPRRVVAPAPAPGAADDQDILVVVSKLKKYIRDRSGMNTSDNVMPLLSDHLRWVAELCIQNARDAGRKTVLDRDVPPLPRR